MFDFLQILAVKALSLILPILIFLGIGNIFQEKITVPSNKATTSVSVFDEFDSQESFDKERISAEIPEKETVPEAAVPPDQSQTKKTTPTAPTRQEINDVAPLVPPKPIPAPEPLLSATFLNEEVRKATVNVFCVTKTAGLVEPLSGSGIVIHEKGVILTNAHVAQFFLLRDYSVKDFIECVIRIGSPAHSAYRAELVYLPPSWVEKNAINLRLSAPLGTGENDFALLRITESAVGKALPETFPFVLPEMELKDLKKDSFVFVSSYPAGFQDSTSLALNLWLTTSVSQIIDVFTFQKTPSPALDIFSIQGTVGAQEGSSGGAVVNFKNGKLLGLIVTRTEGKTTGERTLRALSMLHIDNVLRKNTGESFMNFISGNLEEKASLFASATAPRLTEILTEVLDR